MPRFFFDINDGIDLIDETGRELPDADAVRVHALEVAAGATTKPGILKEDGGAVLVSVRDEAGARPLEVRLAFTITAG